LACAAALCAGVPVPAQEQPPTFRSDTQVVLLDVVARDKKGRRVEDLRQQELQVFEDGQLCEIASFRLVRPLAAPASARLPPRLPPQRRRLPRPPRRKHRPAANLVVLVFDVLRSRRRRSHAEARST
jgi:VWFA-related protein